MLVYDITQEKTFDNIAKWLRNIDEVRNVFSMLLKWGIFMKECISRTGEDCY